MLTRRPTWTGFRHLPQPGHPRAASLLQRGVKNIFPVDSCNCNQCWAHWAIQLHSRIMDAHSICLRWILKILFCLIKWHICVFPRCETRFSQVMLASGIGSDYQAGLSCIARSRKHAPKKSPETFNVLVLPGWAKFWILISVWPPPQTKARLFKVWFQTCPSRKTKQAFTYFTIQVFFFFLRRQLKSNLRVFF